MIDTINNDTAIVLVPNEIHAIFPQVTTSNDYDGSSFTIKSNLTDAAKNNLTMYSGEIYHEDNEKLYGNHRVAKGTSGAPVFNYFGEMLGMTVQLGRIGGAVFDKRATTILANFKWNEIKDNGKRGVLKCRYL